MLAVFTRDQLKNLAHSRISESVASGAVTVRIRYAAMIDNRVIAETAQARERLRCGVPYCGTGLLTLGRVGGVRSAVLLSQLTHVQYDGWFRSAYLHRSAMLRFLFLSLNA